jgi:signal recognition particle receptor subunit beta
MWDELSYNALGAVVLVDTRRLADSWPAIEFFEIRGIAYVVAVNDFDGAQVYQDRDIRDALRITDEIPLVRCDARVRKSAAGTLIKLIDYLMSILGSGSTTTLATTI